uniref:Uncharacterized protein n=1 Tax=Dulem virus 42 TaxID=3145760 RepID=A0AAU8B8R5_9CAUD
MAYKAAIIKERQDKEDEDEDDDSSLNVLRKSRGPLELEVVESKDDTHLFTRRTKDIISDLLDDNPKNLLSVMDQEGNPIQQMDQSRKFFHRYRKYTARELTYWYDPDEKDGGHIYIHGISDDFKLRYIWVEGFFDGDDEDADEDEIQIPDWMIPDIKKRIMTNELAFMLNRISDDDNNSTLDGIKPQTQQLSAYEK